VQLPAVDNKQINNGENKMSTKKFNLMSKVMENAMNTKFYSQSKEAWVLRTDKLDTSAEMVELVESMGIRFDSTVDEIEEIDDDEILDCVFFNDYDSADLAQFFND
jgi:hypothetical protein